VRTVGNPHKTTKANIGLANVSNDAQLKADSNLADLTDPKTAHANLGLGEAARMNIGTTEDSVAAGNHTHNAETISNRTWQYKASVNLKNTGATTIFTTEANKGRFFCISCWFHADNVSSLGLYAPTVNIGHTAANYSDYVSSQALPNSYFASNQFLVLAMRGQSGVRISAAPSTPIKANVIQASDAGSYAGTFFIEGFYLQD